MHRGAPEPVARVRRAWGAEISVCALAALLAFGTLAWEQALHAFVLASEPVDAGPHFVRDGLLLIPVALAAAWWGLRPRRGRAPGVWRAATGVAAAFAVLLAPSAAAHRALHAADEAGVALAGPRAGAPTEPREHADAGIADALLHALTDALLALPAAFVLSLGALALLRRRRRPLLYAGLRRRLVVTASTLVLAGAAALVPVSGAASPDYAKFSTPLTIPPVLTGKDINITMAQTQQQILPGSPTTMWTYNGSFPGPTIRRPTGEPTNVTFTNDLPQSAGSMTVHHHGAQASQEDDGHPSRYLIAPGASKTYTYPAVDNSVPERAAPQWYHDHRDMVTGRNVWMGLAGAFIYDDPLEQSLNLPKGPYDVPLMVTDREFDSNNQIPYDFVQGGTFGDVILVNGVPQPFQSVGDRRYRFRLYNISNRRDYTFGLSNGQQMTQIGTDSGLLPAPVSRSSIRLGPAERADVVIDFAGHLNEQIVLRNLDAALGPGDRDAEVMQFRVDRDVEDDSSPVPASLRPVALTDPPVLTRTWSFDRAAAAEGRARWTINGQGFDPNRVDAEPRLGTTERWVLRNPTTLPHLAHIHLGDQTLVSRNGQPVPYERVKETWYLAPGDEVVVDIKFTDYIGEFIFHCHVLEHEDDSMMTQFRTVASPPAAKPPGAGQPRPGGAAKPKPKPKSTKEVSLALRILSGKRLGRLLGRGLRFEAGVRAKRAKLRAKLSARGRTLGVVRRSALPRGRVRLTLKPSRRGRQRLRRLLSDRRRVRALLVVRAGGSTAKARFAIRR